MGQSDHYKHKRVVDRVANQTGADIERNVIRTVVKEIDSEVGIEGDVTADVESVGVEDSSGVLVDPATEATVSSVLSALQGTLQTEQQTPVGVEKADGTQIDPATEATVSSVLSALQGTLTAAQDNATATENSTALASGGTVTNALSVEGAEVLDGRVVRSNTTYDVTVKYLDSAGGNVLFTESVASGVAAGTETTISVTGLVSPHVEVEVADAGSGSGAVTATLHMR